MTNNNLTALITRPEPYGQRLAQQLNQANVATVCQPVFSYQSSSETFDDTLTEYAIVIFVSVAAVNYGAHQLSSLKGTSHSPQIFAVGKATQAALATQGISAISPTHHSTEGLLALELLARDNINGKRILIVRGDGGRECLASGLRSRGAIVNYWECYQRVWLDLPDDIAQIWQQNKVNCIIITSNNILKYVVNLLKRADNYWENNGILVVASERIAQAAKAHGFHHIINAQGANDEAIVSAIRNIGTKT